MSQSSVLPLGKINLQTGKCKYFNVYETWGEDTTYEIYKTKKGFKIVATSGTSPINKIGKGIFAIHDQNMRFLFEGQMVDFAVGSQLKEKIETYGRLISGYTYK